MAGSTSVIQEFNTALNKDDQIRRQKGASLQELREVSSYIVLQHEVGKATSTDKSQIRKQKAKSRRNLIPLMAKDKKTQKKEGGDVSILSSSAASPAITLDLGENFQDLKSVLQTIHPMKTPTDQQQGLSALEMLSYDPQYHASIHEPSVIQNLYFFIRAPPTPPTLQQLELLTLASSILANVCIGFPKLADDLILLGMYGEIVKLLNLLETELGNSGGGSTLPLPAIPGGPAPPSDGGIGGSQRQLVVELAIEKVMGLLVNLQAKKKNQTLPYVEEDEAGGAGETILEVCVKLLRVQGLAANRGVMLCLKNLMHEAKLLKKMLSNTDGLSLMCSNFSRYFSPKGGQKLGEGGVPVFGQSSLSSSAYSVTPEGVAIDWLWAFSLFAWHSDELLPLVRQHHVAPAALHLLSYSASQASPSSPSGSWALLQFESARVLSFLTYSGCEGLVSPNDVSDVFLELLISGGGPWSTITTVELAGFLGRLGGGGGKMEDLDFPNHFFKFCANVLANISMGDEEVVLGMVKDDRLLVKLVGVLEEGDRTTSLTQIKIATLFYNLMQTKEGRQAVASVRKIKDVFRSQMSSTNKVLRDIISRCIAELRDESKKGGDDENQVEKMKAKRRRIMDELMSTEKTYVDHLLQMVAMFLRYKAISMEAKNKSDSENATEMHRNVEGLSSLHFKFLQELQNLKKQEAAEEENSEAGGEGDDEKERITLGGVLKEQLVGKLDIYRTYTQNFEKYQSIVDTKSFKKFLEAERKAEMKSQKKRVDMTPQSLLITPIQRIPRYVLLLEDLLDHMSVDSEDYNNLNEAFEGLMEMMETIEDEKVRVEAMMKVAQLQKKFLNLPFDLVRDSRVIIREGSCLLDDPLHDSLRKAHLFLFSDCVIIATVSGGGGMVGVGGGSGSKYKVRHVLPLYQGEFFEVEAVSVEEDGGEKVWEGFGVRSLVDGEVDLKLYVESGGERDGWVSGLLEAKMDDEELWQDSEGETLAIKICTSDAPYLRPMALHNSSRRITVPKTATVGETFEIFSRKLTFGLPPESKNPIMDGLKGDSLYVVAAENTSSPPPPLLLPMDGCLARTLKYLDPNVSLVVQAESMVAEAQAQARRNKENKANKGVNKSKMLKLVKPVTGGSHLGSPGKPLALSSGNAGGDGGNRRGSGSHQEENGVDPLSSSVSVLGLNDGGKTMVRVYLPKNGLTRQMKMADYVSVLVANDVNGLEMKELAVKACLRGKDEADTLKIRMDFKSYGVWLIDGKTERALGADDKPYLIQARWPRQKKGLGVKVSTKETLPTRRFGLYPVGSNNTGNYMMENLFNVDPTKAPPLPPAPVPLPAPNDPKLPVPSFTRAQTESYSPSTPPPKKSGSGIVRTSSTPQSGPPAPALPPLPPSFQAGSGNVGSPRRSPPVKQPPLVLQPPPPANGSGSPAPPLPKSLPPPSLAPLPAPAQPPHPKSPPHGSPPPPAPLVPKSGGPPPIPAAKPKGAGPPPLPSAPPPSSQPPLPASPAPKSGPPPIPSSKPKGSGPPPLPSSPAPKSSQPPLPSSPAPKSAPPIPSSKPKGSGPPPLPSSPAPSSAPKPSQPPLPSSPAPKSAPPIHSSKPKGSGPPPLPSSPAPSSGPPPAVPSKPCPGKGPPPPRPSIPAKDASLKVNHLSPSHSPSRKNSVGPPLSLSGSPTPPPKAKRSSLIISREKSAGSSPPPKLSSSPGSSPYLSSSPSSLSSLSSSFASPSSSSRFSKSNMSHSNSSGCLPTYTGEKEGGGGGGGGGGGDVKKLSQGLESHFKGMGGMMAGPPGSPSPSRK